MQNDFYYNFIIIKKYKLEEYIKLGSIDNIKFKMNYKGFIKTS